LRIAVTEQGPPEGPVAGKIEVLLASDLVLGPALEDLARLEREVIDQAGVERLGQEAQAMGPGPADEFLEIDGIIRLREMLVEDLGVGDAAEEFALGAEDPGVGSRLIG
jgi:hypothetical protein